MNKNSFETLLKEQMPWRKNLGEPLKRQNFLSLERRINQHHRKINNLILYIGAPISAVAISLLMILPFDRQDAERISVPNLNSGASEILISSFDDLEKELLDGVQDET